MFKINTLLNKKFSFILYISTYFKSFFLDRLVYFIENVNVNKNVNEVFLWNKH